jgi:hypothetical protein
MAWCSVKKKKKKKKHTGTSLPLPLLIIIDYFLNIHTVEGLSYFIFVSQGMKNGWKRCLRSTGMLGSQWQPWNAARHPTSSLS